MRKQLFFIIPLLLLIALIFWSSVTVQDFFSNVFYVVEGYIRSQQVLGIIFFVLLAAVSAFLSPFSSIPLVPFAVLFWGEATTVILLTIGWLLGGIIAYAVGRYAGYPILLRLVPLEKIKKYEEHIPSELAFQVLLLFRLVMPSEITSYILGIIRYKFWHYFIITLISELIFAVLAVYTSGAILEQKPLLIVSWLVAIIVIFLSAYYLLKKKSRK